LAWEFPIPSVDGLRPRLYQFILVGRVKLLAI
jgi:hypothetical protein